MNARNKKRLISAVALILIATASIYYYHFLRRPSQVMSGPAVLHRTFSHAARAQAVEFSPTGDTVASGSLDGTVKIWRQDDGRIIQELKHPAGITSLAYSPDGNYLATGSYDALLRVWRVADATLVTTHGGHEGTIWTVAFAPDGKTVASAGEDKTIRLWSVAGVLVRTIPAHDLNVWSVTFNADGRKLASGSFDRSIKIWDVHTGNLEQTLNAHTQAVLEVDFSSDGKRLVSCGDDSVLRIWNTGDWTVQHTLTGSEHIYACNFSADGGYVLSGGRDRSTFGELLQNFLGLTENNKGVSVRLWNAANGTLVQSFAEHADDVYGVAISPDGKWLAAAGLDNRVAVWRLPLPN